MFNKKFAKFQIFSPSVYASDRLRINIFRTVEYIFIEFPTENFYTVSLYIIYTPICFDISVSSSGNFTFVPC